MARVHKARAENTVAFAWLPTGGLGPWKDDWGLSPPKRLPRLSKMLLLCQGLLALITEEENLIIQL